MAELIGAPNGSAHFDEIEVWWTRSESFPAAS